MILCYIQGLISGIALATVFWVGFIMFRIKP